MGITSRGRFLIHSSPCIDAAGSIKAGYYADLVLFDPDVIEDRSTMQDSTALSVGIRSVWVNGVLAFNDDEPLMVYPGRIVSRGEN